MGRGGGLPKVTTSDWGEGKPKMTNTDEEGVSAKVYQKKGMRGQPKSDQK